MSYEKWDCEVKKVVTTNVEVEIRSGADETVAEDEALERYEHDPNVTRGSLPDFEVECSKK